MEIPKEAKFCHKCGISLHDKGRVKESRINPVSKSISISPKINVSPEISIVGSGKVNFNPSINFAITHQGERLPIDEYIAEIDKSLSQYKESLKKSKSSEELFKNKRMVVELLGKLAVIHAETGNKAELLNCLGDLKFYTERHADELMNAINTVEYLIREDISISEQLIEGVRSLVHKIEREMEGLGDGIE